MTADTTPAQAADSSRPSERVKALRAHLAALGVDDETRTPLPHTADSHNRPASDPNYDGCDSGDGCDCPNQHHWNELERHSALHATLSAAGLTKTAELALHAASDIAGNPALYIVWRHHHTIAITETVVDPGDPGTLIDRLLAVHPSDPDLAYTLEPVHDYAQCGVALCVTSADRAHNPYGPAISSVTSTITPDQWSLWDIGVTGDEHAALTGDAELLHGFQQLAGAGMSSWRDPNISWRPRRELPVELPAHGTGSAYQLDDIVAAASNPERTLRHRDRTAEISGQHGIGAPAAQAAADTELDDREVRVYVELLTHSELTLGELADAARLVSAETESGAAATPGTPDTIRS